MMEEEKMTDVDEEEEEGEYTVEKVVGKRINKDGRTEYLLKWLGWGDGDNSWQFEENLLNCIDLIEEFERKSMEKKQKNNNVERKSKTASKSDNDRLRGFERGLEPERIIGATDSTGELRYLLKWIGSGEADLISAREANEKCPQTVIKFYEQCLSWQDQDQDQEREKKVEAKCKSKASKSGFERGLEPERIIGATDSPGELMLLIKWKGSDRAELVRASEANLKCAQMVIKFYQEKLTWEDPDPEDDVDN